MCVGVRTFKLYSLAFPVRFFFFLYGSYFNLCLHQLPFVFIVFCLLGDFFV